MSVSKPRDRRHNKLPGYSRTSNPKKRLFNPTLDIDPRYNVFNGSDEPAEDTDPVKTISDVTGTYDFTQATEANRPLYDATNKSLIFDGTNDSLSSSTIALLDNPAAMTLFLVVNHTAATQTLLSFNYNSGAGANSDRALYVSTTSTVVSANGYDDSAALKTSSGPNTATSKCLITLIKNHTGEISIYVNGKYHGTTDFVDAVLTSLVRLTLGAYSDDYTSPANMTLYRLLVYTRELSYTELTTVHKNLGNIYDITTSHITNDFLPDLKYTIQNNLFVTGSTPATHNTLVGKWTDLINNVDLLQGTDDNKPTYDATNNELVFTGGDYLQATSVAQNSGDIHTIIVRCRHSNTGTQYVFSMSQNSVQSQYLKLVSDTEEAYGRTSGNTNLQAILENNTPDDDYHTYIIKLREDDNVTIYKLMDDGNILVGSVNGANKAHTTNSSLTLGDFYASLGTSPLEGAIKYFYYFNRELTIDEITEWYNREVNILPEPLAIIDPINNSYKDAAVSVAVTDYLASADDFTITTPFTISGWIYFPDSAPTDTPCISCADYAGQSGIFILGTLSGYFIFIVKDGSGDIVALETGVAIEANTWYFVSGYYNGTHIGIQVNDNEPVETAISQLNTTYTPLYINGVEVATTPTGGVPCYYDSVAFCNAYVDPNTFYNESNGYIYDELPAIASLQNFWNFDEDDNGPWTDSHGSVDLTGTGTRIGGIISSLASSDDPVSFVQSGDYIFSQPVFTKRPLYSTAGLVFDGTDDFLINTDINLRMFTIVAKVTCDNEALENPYLVWYGDDIESAPAGFSLNLAGAIYMYQTSGRHQRTYEDILDSTEHIVVYTFGGTAGSHRLYPTGITYLGDDDQNVQVCADFQYDMYIGSDYLGGNNLNGTLSELRIYNRLLSQSEIEAVIASL